MRVQVVTVAVEGDHDAAVVRRVLKDIGLEAGTFYGGKGKGFLDRCLAGFNQAAQYSPWLVVRDLDQDAKCAPTLVQKILVKPASQMCFRVAVRSLETWLMADREEMSRFLHVPLALLPLTPESLPHPKKALVELAKHSKKREIREDMAPNPATGAPVGKGYTWRIIEFANERWSPQRAAKHSESLDRCIRALRRWA